MLMMTAIKRVVSCFILSGNPTRQDLRIAVFHRVDTMPTFASHWAACSGSIEEGESPNETACRELQEETNLSIASPSEEGLFVNVPFRRSEERETIIRVYPFTVQLPDKFKLQLRGTEHDCFKFVSVAELESLTPAVPSLAKAFHHATHGRFLEANEFVQEWANDHVSGAATMTRNALKLVASSKADPEIVKLFRPSMVAITNAMNRVLDGEHAETVMESLELETTRAVDYAVNIIEPLLKDKSKHNPLVIATFSRSSTLVRILKRLLLVSNGDSPIQILCSKSTPGDEGVLMAQDLSIATTVDDEELLQLVGNNQIDLILTGSDCVTEQSVVNKIGTARLVQAAATSPKCKVYCCADRWKQWDDVFPPPLEDIFEAVPIDLFDKILVPDAPLNECKAT